MASNVGDLGGTEELDVVANPLKMSDDEEETDDNIFVKTADTLGAADILEAVVDGLNPSAGGQDWVLTDLSVDGILGTALFGLCANLGLSSCKSNLAQTTLIVVTYAALTEFAQHALGIGTGFAKIDFNGIALAQISKKVDELLVNVGKLMREPLNSAKYGLEQSLIYFQFGDITQALDLLKEVRSNATKALSTLDTSGDEDQRVKDLVLATQSTGEEFLSRTP